MTTVALTALLPVILVSLTAIAVMLLISIHRESRPAFVVTVLGFAVSLASVPYVMALAPVAVTDLMIVDRYALTFMALFMVSALIVTLLCRGYFLHELNPELYMLLATATLGAMILVASSHLAMFFLGLEILSVSLFPMIAYRTGDSLSLESGIKYLILSGISSAFLLFGMALVYCQTGVMSFESLALALGQARTDDALTLVGLFMIVGAIAFKLSLVPFHLWTPDVYQGAPAPVAAYVATVSKGSILALLLRYWIDTAEVRPESLIDILGLLGAVSVLFGNFLALRQDNLKRLLAYSSIAHMGYALIGFVAAAMVHLPMMIETVGMYLFAYILTTLTAFGVISVLSNDGAEWEAIMAYQGLAWYKPGLAAILTVSLLSLAGIPLTIGFVGKFFVLVAGVDARLWPLVWIVILGSGIGIYYYLRIVRTLIQVPETATQAVEPPDRAVTHLVLACLALLLLVLGVLPTVAIDALANVAKSLI